MDFLDKETEYILEQCVDNESTYPQILVDMLKQCKTELERTHLRGRINILVKEGYLLKISWADNLPYIGHIERHRLLQEERYICSCNVTK